MNLQSMLVTLWDNQVLEIGHKLCVSSEDCKHISIALRGRTLYGKTEEIGRCNLDWPTTSGEQPLQWLPVRRKVSHRIVGYVRLSCSSVHLDEEECVSL